MRDFSPLVIGVLALVSAVVALLWCLGRSSRRVPVCRACGRDVRTFAWREPCVCDCGAPLMRRRAVRCVRRVRRRSLGLGIVAVVLIASTTALAWWAIQVRADGVGWMDTLPTRVYAWALARGWDEPWHVSAGRRLAEQPPLDEVAMLRDAALDLWWSESPRRAESWRLVLRTAAIAVPTGAEGARFIAAMPENIDAIVEEGPGGVAIEIRSVDRHSGEIRPLMLRIDEVRIGDRVVPFTIVLEGRLPPDEIARGARRLWHPVVGTDREGALRLLIGRDAVKGEQVADESDGGVVPDAVRIRGAAAYASNLLDALLYDEIIATTRDPLAWGVPVATGPLELSGAAAPGRTAPEGLGRPQPWSARWWPGVRGYHSMPALVGIPVVTMALTGALAGLLLVIAVAGARAAWRGPVRLSPPTCRGCGALLRGKEQTLPVSCSECGRAVTSIDDCRCVVRHRRWPLAAVAFILIAGAGVWLVPRAYHGIDRELHARFATPEREAGWLVDATMESRPTGIGPVPGNRLTGGMLDSTSKRGWAQNPAAHTAAARALLTWWSETGGALPSTPSDLDGLGRRLRVAEFLAEAVASGVLSVDAARPIGEWCGAGASFPPMMRLPRVVRAGDPLRPIPRYTNSTEAVVSAVVEPRAWHPPQTFTLATPEEAGTLDIEMIWSRAKSPAAEAPPIHGEVRAPASAVEGDPVFEQVLRERVRVLPAETPMALTGSALAEVVSNAKAALRVREGATRSAVQLSEDPGMSGDLWWKGRWEILVNDAPDAEPCAVMRRLPTGWSPAALGTLPSPLPEELLLRIVPEVPESAFTSPGTRGFMCGETVTFRLRRSGEEDYEHSRVVVYRTAPTGT